MSQGNDIFWWNENRCYRTVTYARGRTSVEIQQWRPLPEPVISRYNKGSFTSHIASSVLDMVAASRVLVQNVLSRRDSHFEYHTRV